MTYHADAVHFDGNFMMSIDSLSATDNEFFSASLWCRNVSGINGTGELMVIDPNGAYTNVLNGAISDPLGGISYDFFDSTRSNGLRGAFCTSPSADVWHHYLISVDTNHGAGSKIYPFYMDDLLIDQSGDGAADDSAPAFTMAFNGLQMTIGDDGFSDGIIGDFADIRIMPGVSLLDGNGLIPEATRRLFIDADGKPVDPAVATASLGTPCILFSGDSSSFSTNQGNGGAFTLTSGALTNADSSPSGTGAPPAEFSVMTSTSHASLIPPPQLVPKKSKRRLSADRWSSPSNAAHGFAGRIFR